MSARVIKPTEDVEPPTLTVAEVCPCESRYTSGARRDPVIWAAWVRVHEAHGFQWGRP